MAIQVGGTTVIDNNRVVTSTGLTVDTDKLHVDSSGNVLVSGTSATAYSDTSGSQIGLMNNGGDSYVAISRSNSASTAYCMVLNRTASTDGDILTFRKQGSTVGTINTAGTNNFRFVSDYGNATIGAGDTGLIMSTAESIRPFNPSTNASRDNAIGFGESYARWVDVWAVDGSINTSDGNEKQQIASLTDAEITAAKAISKLFKSYKWNSAVDKKGNAARTHTGVIAQDVQQAMTDAGLDAGDYAFFISSTWWETETDVPAVEAVEAQDAVYDEEGNLVSEAVEAVEAKEAYTRTDIYDTLEEAPEGATERTRLGIRYHELLTFIGAATEQRLASIEARLDALESA